MIAEENTSEAAAPAARRSPLRERLFLLATCALVGWFDLWTLQSTGQAWSFGTEQNDYYNLLIDGWLDGQLHLKVPVSEALLQLPDPYDPAQRPAGIELHDASLYRGKYYLYFGAAPVVLLMLPFRVLTGIDLPVGFAVLSFVLAGFLASVDVWWRVRRRYFPDTSAGVALLGVLVLGLASLGPVLLRRPHMWELPIAAGYCFAMVALGAVERCLHSPRRRAAWLGVAGLAAGLAVASRPPYLFATWLLALPVLWWWRAERRRPWREFGALVAPLAVVGMLMAWHNYARFDHPLEFGQKYQLTYYDERAQPHFGLRYAGFNTWRYFLSPAQWSAYFPFIAPAELPPKPPGFSGHDDVYGVLVNLPFAWLAVLAPLALWRRAAEERARLGAWLAVVAGLFLALAALLSCFFGSLARYEVDFTPALMLLACVGLLALDRWAGVLPAIARRTALALGAILAVGSAGFGALFALHYDGRLARHNPAEAEAVARALNWIPHGIERLLGVRHGGVAFAFRAEEKAPGDETLLTVGAAPRVDRVVLRRRDDGRVQFGLANSGWPELWSRPLPIGAAPEHRVEVVFGSLLPPRTHPIFAGLAADDVSELTRQVRLTVDGEPLIDERRDLPAGGRGLRVGEARSVERLPAIPPARPLGFARLRLTPPQNIATPREPLLGVAGGPVVFMHYLDDAGQIAFGSSDGGGRGPPGNSMVIEPARAHEVVARWFATDDPSRRRLELRVEGTIAWSRELRWPEGELVIGRNLAGEPGCAAVFSGVVHSVQQTSDGRDPLWRPEERLRLLVRFPRGREGAREPLLVTGRPGAGDLLFVEYVSARTVRFAVDHWGGELAWSEPVAIDFGAAHEIRVDTTMLRGPTPGTPRGLARQGAVRIEIDGGLAWAASVPTFAVRPDEIAVGRNPIGGTSCGPRFSGDLLAAERIGRE